MPNDKTNAERQKRWREKQRKAGHRMVPVDATGRDVLIAKLEAQLRELRIQYGLLLKRFADRE